jgi:predicted ATPase/class 3 adenylate cyclase
MPDLPTGTVTFLFTDIEGSTRLLEQLGTGRYEPLQDRHAAILEGAIDEGGGTVVRIEGDAYFAAFPTPTGAIRAVVSAQRDLAAHPWPEDGAIRVRMGLHSGEGRLGGGDYIGIDPNRAARIAAAGHGGQVVMSDATRALAEHDLPEGVAVRDLGTHRLKDLAHPEHLFDLLIDGLPSDFPVLKTLDARPNNLPAQLTSFVGRERQIAETERLVREHRLLTLTGPGGTGKTRLALAAGADLLPSFADGVFLVELASLVDPGQVCPAICQVLGVREEPGRDVIDTMVDRLLGRSTLLILDNFEHLLEAGPMVGETLQRAPEVRILVTSRARLGVYGEQELQVPPLALPDTTQDLEVLSRAEAVALFVDRAGEARPGFDLTEGNASAVAEICTRLDGLPLAIELAASRTTVLTPEEILSRLGHRLDLLTTGARNLPPRQRTLRGAIEWSYELLEKQERRLFARMSAFSGGADLDAAETVCNPGGDLGVITLDGLAALVDKGLVRRLETSGGAPRFGMLETIREYAAERLDADWDADETRRRHAEHFLALAEASERDIPAQDHTMLNRLDWDQDNLQAAFRWAVEAGESERGMAAAASIWRFWVFRGHLGVGRAVLDRLLEAPSGRTEARARAHGAAGSLAYWNDDLPSTEHHYGEQLAIYRELGDRAGVARALYDLAFVPYIRRTGFDDALPLLREALELFEQLGDEENASKARGDIPYFMMLAGQLEDAAPLLEEALARARGTGDFFQVLDNLFRVAEARLRLGDADRARTAALEALDITERGDIEGAMAAVLELVASAEAVAGRHRRALRLFGAGEAMADPLGGGSFPSLPMEPVEESRKALGEDAAEEALAKGRAMSRQEAVAYARAED